MEGAGGSNRWLSSPLLSSPLLSFIIFFSDICPPFLPSPPSQLELLEQLGLLSGSVFFYELNKFWLMVILLLIFHSYYWPQGRGPIVNGREGSLLFRCLSPLLIGSIIKYNCFQSSQFLLFFFGKVKPSGVWCKYKVSSKRKFLKLL